MRAVDNLHVRDMTPLIAPRALQQMFPLDETANATVFEAREIIQRVLHRKDQRLIAVVGPCSVHDPEAALDYASKLVELHRRYRDRLFILMRVYLEKPRTTVGWRGLINDPYIDGSFDMSAGLHIARDLLLRINRMGLPVATEMLDPISPQYISDLIALAAIGARTSESQTHRAMASGLSMPVGFKNTTDGSLEVAVQACISARNPHSFFGVNQDGAGCVVRTSGNPDGLVILRGSRHGPNYSREDVARTEQLMIDAKLPPAALIDCSHANSRSDYTRQPAIWNEVLERRLTGEHSIIGMMVESNLFEGKQAVPSDLSTLRYGVSITDACVGWETTEQMLQQAYTLLGRA